MMKQRKSIREWSRSLRWQATRRYRKCNKCFKFIKFILTKFKGGKRHTTIFKYVCMVECNMLHYHARDYRGASRFRNSDERREYYLQICVSSGSSWKYVIDFFVPQLKPGSQHSPRYCRYTQLLDNWTPAYYIFVNFKLFIKMKLFIYMTEDFI